MRLYLIQHAKAKSKQENPARPLSRKGREDIRKVAGFLKGYTQSPIREIKHSERPGPNRPLRSWRRRFHHLKA